MKRLVSGVIGLMAAVAAGAAALQLMGAVADEPRLPDTAPPIAPLHRGADGSIEILDPATARRAGMPLCSKGALCVGPGQHYRTLAAGLAAAKDGDVVELIGGTYRESATLFLRHLTLRGVAGRPHIDCAGLALAGDRACLLLAADGITLDNLELSGAAPIDASDETAVACIAGLPDLDFSLSAIVCHGAQNGIIAHGGTILIDESDFYDNGGSRSGNNVALDDGCLLTVRSSTFRDAKHGAELIARCARVTISDSTFRSAAGKVALELPEGGEVMVYRSTFEKVRDAVPGDFVRFSAEGCRYPGSMLLKDVRIVNVRPDTGVRNFDRCFGSAIVLEHVTVEGVAVQETGYVLAR